MGVLLYLLWLSVPAYLVMQVVALLRTSGRTRVAAIFPLLMMIPVLGWTAYSFWEASNLWPLLMLFTSPIALMYVTVVSLVNGRTATTDITNDGNTRD